MSPADPLDTPAPAAAPRETVVTMPTLSTMYQRILAARDASDVEARHRDFWDAIEKLYTALSQARAELAAYDERNKAVKVARVPSEPAT